MDLKENFTLRINANTDKKVRKLAKLESKTITQKYEEIISEAIEKYEKEKGEIDLNYCFDIKDLFK